MSDVFISYARSSEEQAKKVEQALRKSGHTVWRDAELPAHRTYAEVIEERLHSAGAVVVLWSADAKKSQWVRAEADAARELGTLVQASVDGTIPPIPFNQIQCADLEGWGCDLDNGGWRKLQASVAALAGGIDEPQQSPKPRRQKTSICVLPFANMSADAEQEYFSDGISEDITTDLSNVSALEVVARNTAFTFKGQSVDVTDVARKLGVSHVLQGSVRKSGNRVRITAQLIDGETGGHLWADRYDRDLTDIFAIQDEISKAIVGSLQLKLLRDEKKAIEQRGTTNAEAYNLYLMARQHWVSGTFGDPRRDEAIIRICRQATLLDPDYAEAWALMALAQSELRFWHGKDENALATAERALAINPELAEPYCVKARYLENEGKQDEGASQIEVALRLSPNSWEVNREAARLLFRQRRIAEAAPFFEKATSLIETDYYNPCMLMSCYAALGNRDALESAAQLTLKRAKSALEQNPTNGAAIAAGAGALALFDEQRAKEWIQRGLLLDPENLSMRYNLGCTLAELGDHDAALDVLEDFFLNVNSVTHVKHIEVDPDVDSIRDCKRFREMLGSAKQRLGITDTSP